MQWHAAALGLLAIMACGPQTVPTGSSGGTSSSTTAPVSETTGGATSVDAPVDSSSSGSSSTEAESSSGSDELLPCRDTLCGGVPVGQTCLCPEGLQCAPDGPFGHVRHCLECRCPAGTHCWGTGTGHYDCLPDSSTGDSTDSTTGDSGSGTSGTGVF